MSSRTWMLHLSVAVAVGAVVVALTPAVADPLPGAAEYPDVVFLARNDVPFDAQTAASMAGQMGAPILLTNPDALSEAAAASIAELDPDVIIVAGGVLAISDDVVEQAAAACGRGCTIDRYAGAGRDETAAALAGIPSVYGFDRPVLQGANQVVGDVHLGGTVNAHAITVQDTTLVAGLNADRLDGAHASAFAKIADVRPLELVAGQGVSSDEFQPPDPLPANILAADELDVAFTTTVPGQLHITYQARFRFECTDALEWAWLVLDGVPIRSSAMRVASGTHHYTMTAVTPETVPPGPHVVKVNAGADPCGTSMQSFMPHATGTVLVLGD